MSEQPDPSELGAAKDTLSHVETKSGSTAKPVFKCQECDHVKDIPQEILEKMENDESFDSPSHHNKPMKISVIS